MNLRIAAELVLLEIKKHPWYLTKEAVADLEKALNEKPEPKPERTWHERIRWNDF